MNRNSFIVVFLLALSLVGFFLIKPFIHWNKGEQIENSGFKGNYYQAKNTQESKIVIVLGGGGFSDYWAEEFSNLGYSALSLPYHRQKGLPDLIERIPLEYFEKAMDWISSKNPHSKKLFILGASTNAELALLLASKFPKKVKGVIAICPSSVTWSNTVFPWSSNEVMSKWTLYGEDLPFVAMKKIESQGGGLLETLPYWNSGLNDTFQIDEATIKVESINGPILLITPEDDTVWPSKRMSKMIESRIKKHAFTHTFTNLVYPNAGHLISAQYHKSFTDEKGEMYIDGVKHQFDFGGTPKGNLKAQLESRIAIVKFIQNQ